MNPLLGLATVVLLILANGWFVAGEFAYVAARRTRLEEAAASGDRPARRALEVTGRLSFMLSGAQLGITATSLVVGFIAAPVFGALLRPLLEGAGLRATVATSLAVTVGFALSTAAQMVLGELGPKNLAIARAEPVARRMATGTLLYLRLAGPVIRLFDGAANRLLRALGIEPVEELEGGVSADELEHIISASDEQGALPAELATLLRRALDFKQLRAADALTPRPQIVAIPHDASCADLATLARTTGHSRFPVVGAEGLDDVVGIVEAKAVLSVPPSERAATPLTGLVEPELAVPESMPLSQLLNELQGAHAQLAVVVDEFGGVAGIVTLEDIVEELVGDILDEYDRAGPSVRPLPGGAFAVPASWRIDEIARDVGVTLPAGDYDTVGGLVMAALGRVPQVGDSVEVEGARLHVLTVDGHAAGTVRIEPVVPHQAGGTP